MSAWLTDLVRLFFESFLGWIRQQGRDEVLTEIKGKTDAVLKKHTEIDARPDSSSPYDRLRGKLRPPETPGGTT